MAVIRAGTINRKVTPQEPQGGGPVNKATLLKKLETMLDEFERGRTWGTIEIEIREGTPNYVRKTSTEKLAQENARARYENNGSR